MDVAVSTKKVNLIPDSEAILMFVHFYKLVFLGTRFTEKVLQIKIETPKPASSQRPPDLDKEGGISADEENKSDGSFIIDTSEMSSDNALYADASSPQSTDSPRTEKEDNYFKIKLHAMQCL